MLGHFEGGMTAAVRIVAAVSREASSIMQPHSVCSAEYWSTTTADNSMVHSISGWTRSVQVKLWDPLRTRAIPEHLGGVFTTRRYTNTRLPLPLSMSVIWKASCPYILDARLRL